MKTCPRCADRHLTVDDVQNSFATHMKEFDKIWPETEKYGPARVHLVDLLNGIRLDLHKRAQANQERRMTAFEQAAVRVTGGDPGKLTRQATPEELRQQGITPSETQAQHAALRERIRRNT